MNLAASVIGLFAMAWAYESTWKKKVLSVGLIYSLSMICDVVVVLLFSTREISHNEPITWMISVLLLIVCQILLDRMRTEQEQAAHIVPHWEPLLIVPILSIILLHYLVVYASGQRTILWEGICLLVINIVIFYLYGKLEQIYLERAEKEVFQQQAKVYANQLDVIRGTQEQVHGLRHDMKHHMREIRAMAANGEIRQIIEYTAQMDQSMDNPDEYAYSENKEIDGNLNYLLKKAHARLRDVHASIKIPKEMQISAFDLNVLLGNLIDNAITAAEKTEDQKLHIKIAEDRGRLMIEVKNSYDGELKAHGKWFLTTKPDIERHGYGLRNVRRIVDRYDGAMDITPAGNEFRVIVLLYMESSGEE